MDTFPPERDGAPPAPAAAARSWPLFTLAALAFLPFAGILFGAVGLTWGLLSSRPRAMTAAFVAAGGALLNIIAFVALTVFVTKDTDIYSQARTVAVQNDLLTLVREIEDFREENSAYPPSLSALQQRPAILRTINIYDQTAGVLKPRIYAYEPSADGRAYDLFSVGPDGEAGTADDIRPVLPDSLAARAGYRANIAASAEAP
ncbi:MAG TPA: type II secretion system protein GspG [Gemmatimonadaceae bacterium]|nr:type II secretion system protein GspG [Gemmatimonadaceae bacterium]